MSISGVSCNSGAQVAATKLKENADRFHQLAAQTSSASRVDSVAISPEAQQLLAQEPGSPQ